ncbi:MATE family efflux transporter [Rhodobacter capsulatus]|uniref:MATE family efflux transporter n=1 Tax=Rhodobacter capsulatus TaxID=1061 RepID=UPI0040282696
MTSPTRAPLSRGPASERKLSVLLSGPILPTLLRLAVPTVLVLLVQTFVGVAETYFVSFLGTEALAGVTLVFPVLMLMQMMANGGIGGGVSAAIARAVGAGRRREADALLWHALVLACGLGAVFMVIALLWGPALYRAMGGTGEALTAAIAYSGVVFAGAIPIWITALLASALRGAGNTTVPALVVLGATAILLPLSPALIFGWGPLPRLGAAGGGAAVLVYYAIAMLAFIGYLRSPRSPLTLRAAPLQADHFKDILGVGLLSAVGTVQANLTILLITVAVGHFGTDAIAGYGIASRLDTLQIPLLFGLGTAVVTMVGINIGAGNAARARRVAWAGAFLALALSEIIGLAAALFPQLWIGLFSKDPEVIRLGALYLHIVAPTYGAAGLGLVLYFASQGANHVLFPVLAGTARMIIAALVGWSAVILFGAPLHALFAIVALSALVYGALTAAAMQGTWGKA